MCKTCGCSDDARPTITTVSGDAILPEAGPAHNHGHSHGHHHGNHAHPESHGLEASRGSRILRLEHAVLAKNDELAQRNRTFLARRHILALNLVSAPGAGKTALLERTVRDLAGEFPVYVIEGDQATDHDAQRVRAAGARVVQINTGPGCHLEAASVARALRELDPAPDSVLFIENVGNLVCPALFDLGESAKVVIASVTEGDDKPVKYPHMYRAGALLILNKIDLLPYVPFDVARWLRFANQVNPSGQTLELSATRGDGLAEWYSWLRSSAATRRGARDEPSRSHV